MSSPITFSHDNDAESALGMGVSVIEAIGTLLAAVADILDGEAIRRRGGPGLYRRLASILLAFLTFAILMQLRQRASSVRHHLVHVTSKTRHYLSHPPAGWAAP